MASRDDLGNDLQQLVLKGVKEGSDRELGRGAYGRVYEVRYCETICAAKEIHSILLEGQGEAELRQTTKMFLRECHQCSKLRHPNIIQFLGVYYPDVGGTAKDIQLPVMVMEMMADSLTSLEGKYHNIPVHLKFSIIHDVSLGLCYLHNHDPPIVHRDLSPNNILLTPQLVAKITDLGVAKVIRADSRSKMTKVPGTVDFMPPECFTTDPIYGTPMDIFSFAGIVLHTFNQQWPTPSQQVEFDPQTRKRAALSEVERRQQYLDKMSGEAEVLRPLVEECLDDDPAVRPTITAVCKRIQSNNNQSKESLKDFIMLYQKSEQQNSHMVQKNVQPQNATKQMENQTKEFPTAEQENDFKESFNPKLISDAPPLIPALTSERYHIKWTSLADLPAPMHSSYVSVQDKKVYVTGSGPNDDSLHHVYVYDFKTDHWNRLPVSGHYYGIPHIIGSKLTIIGGRLSANTKRTNKVSTYDKASQTWISYYPDMVSARSRPAVVTHQEHVIVAGGTKGDGIVQDDIEILNWPENTEWRRVSMALPVPMYNISCTISDGYLVIVNYHGSDFRCHNNVYKILVADIAASQARLVDWIMPNKWWKLTSATHWAALVPNSSPLMIMGGSDHRSTKPTADIGTFDSLSKSWKKIRPSLTTARSPGTIAAVNNNAIVVIGGCTNRVTVTTAKSSSLTTVELGQAELLQ